MEIKSGDIVKINMHTFWICDCSDAPLNNLNSKECNFCNCSRPTTLAVNTPLAIEDDGDSVPYGLSFRETEF